MRQPATLKTVISAIIAGIENHTQKDVLLELLCIMRGYTLPSIFWKQLFPQKICFTCVLVKAVEADVSNSSLAHNCASTDEQFPVPLAELKPR